MKKEEVKKDKLYKSTVLDVTVEATGRVDRVEFRDLSLNEVEETEFFSGRVIHSPYHLGGYYSDKWLCSMFIPLKEELELKRIDKIFNIELKTLLKDNRIEKITFTKSRKVKVKFSFIQNKISFSTIKDIVSILSCIQELNTEI